MNFIKKNALYGIFTIALASTLGSYYFSEVLGWAPCSLCWYQRLIMLGLVLLITTSIYIKDDKVSSYIKTFSILGAAVAFFHNLLYWGVIPESAVPCENGVSCVADYLDIWGFITIPLLSLAAFVVVLVLVFISGKKEIKN